MKSARLPLPSGPLPGPRQRGARGSRRTPAGPRAGSGDGAAGGREGRCGSQAAGERPRGRGGGDWQKEANKGAENAFRWRTQPIRGRDEGRWAAEIGTCASAGSSVEKVARFPTQRRVAGSILAGARIWVAGSITGGRQPVSPSLPLFLKQWGEISSGED